MSPELPPPDGTGHLHSRILDSNGPARLTTSSSPATATKIRAPNRFTRTLTRLHNRHAATIRPWVPHESMSTLLTRALCLPLTLSRNTRRPAHTPNQDWPTRRSSHPNRRQKASESSRASPLDPPPPHSARIRAPPASYRVSSAPTPPPSNHPDSFDWNRSAIPPTIACDGGAPHSPLRSRSHAACLLPGHRHRMAPCPGTVRQLTSPGGAAELGASPPHDHHPASNPQKSHPPRSRARARAGTLDNPGRRSNPTHADVANLGPPPTGTQASELAETDRKLPADSRATAETASSPAQFQPQPCHLLRPQMPTSTSPSSRA